MIDLSNIVKLVLDTETASFEKGVCELAFYQLNNDAEVIARFRSLIDPECPISPDAAGVHGITDDDVRDAPTLSEYMDGNWKNIDVLMIGHNIGFDIGHVKEEFGTIIPLCTLKLSRLAYPNAPNHKLPTLMHYLKLTRAGNHNALDDVHTTWELLIRLMEHFGTGLQGLLQIANTPVLLSTVPFGKYVGKEFKSVPFKYWEWLVKNSTNMDDNLKYTLQQLYPKLFS
jgi:DNA polymerase III epsilon subunit-like protein